MSGHTLHRVIGGDVQADFDPHGRLMALSQSSGGHVFLAHPDTAASPWQLIVRDERGRSRTLTALDAHACHSERRYDGLILSWSEIERAPGLNVTCTVQPGEDRLLWRLTVGGLTPNTALWRADFPVLDGLFSINDDDERLLLPRAGGYLIRHPSRALFADPQASRRLSLAYPGGLTMQFIAYYRHRGDGLLLLAQDTAGYYKRPCAPFAAIGPTRRRATDRGPFGSRGAAAARSTPGKISRTGCRKPVFGYGIAAGPSRCCPASAL